jgi:hypothetical protein
MGGLMVNRGRMVSNTTILNNWIPWSSQDIPICSCISHTARVLICLPDQSDTVWNWLWGNQTPQGRMAATHGVEPAGNTNAPGPNINRQGPSVRKPVKEVKGNHNVKHYGVNIALGGVNNTNPVSGKGIRENGKHGHLYLAYYRGGPRYAILVGTEQSAPIDRQEAQKGTFGKFKSVFRAFNVPDQYGGGHGFGGHSRFSATGGDDFSYISGHGRAPTQLEDYGPSWGHYIDGMYVDLTGTRFNRLRNQQFAPEKVGEKGNPPA